MARSLSVCFQKIFSSLVSVNIFSEVSMGHLIRFVVLMSTYASFSTFYVIFGSVGI